MGIAVTQYTMRTPLTTNTRLLVSRKVHLRNWLGEGVDEDVSSFESLSNLLSMCDILSKDGGTETGVGVVGTGNDFFLIRPRLRWDDGTEWLFLNDSGVVWWIVDDCWLNEETLAGGNGVGALSELISLLLAVLEKGLDLLILHRVLDRTKQDTFLIGCANLDGLCELDHSLHEFRVDGLVDVDSLGSNANLARVEESTHRNFRNSFVHVDVGENDAWVVATEFEGDAFEGLCAGFHDLLPGCDGAGEGDLRDTRVGSKHGAELVVTSEDLDDAWWENLLGELYDLECGVWSKWRWLDNDCAAGKHCWGNLANSK